MFQRNEMKILFKIGLIVALLSGCAKPPVAVVAPSIIPSIPAKVAIAPVQVSKATVTLPFSGEKNIAERLSNPATKSIEDYVKKKGVFSGVVAIKEEDIPAAPSIQDVVRAGREIEADIVLLGKIVEFKGEPDYGFRAFLKEHIVIELSAWETATGARLWFKKEGMDLERNEPIVAWSDAKIEDRYVSMAVEEGLPLALSKIVPKLHEDMASYKPPAKEKIAAATAEFLVDVDRVPRTATEIKKNAYAVVIGIETYRDLPQAEFTVRDAKIMKEYLIRVMGFPEENIVSLLNERATKGDIEGYMGTWLKNNVERDSTVFIYYAGHGAPNPLTGEAFIIPFDGNPAFPEATGIPLNKFYQMLSELKVRDTFVVMDSCFSGSGGRSVMAKGGRPMAISVENPVLAQKNIVVMTAAKGTEISSSYPEKRHGLFTYFFLKGLQGEADFNGDKTVTIAELYNYLTPHVKKIAREQKLEQTSTLLPGIDMLGIKADMPLGQVSK